MPDYDYTVGQAAAVLYKSAGDAELSYGLSGKLYLSRSGWLLLSVPNAIGRGAFDALNEPGTEIPGDPYNAHISVMTPEDILKIGGPDKISERGHEMTYTTGPVRTVVPDGQRDLSRVWFIEVNSPALETLRKSYGLSATPRDGQYAFHITFAVRRKHVLFANPITKAASLVHDYAHWSPRRRRQPLAASIFFVDNAGNIPS